MLFWLACRFIDDECNLNYGGEFDRSFPSLYPKELELKCEHEGSHATILELDIRIVDGKFIYKLFDKRNDFPFSIVRMPHYTGNIPSHVFMDHWCQNSYVSLVPRCCMKIFNLWHPNFSRGWSIKVVQQLWLWSNLKKVWIGIYPPLNFLKHLQTWSTILKLFKNR